LCCSSVFRTTSRTPTGHAAATTRPLTGQVANPLRGMDRSEHLQALSQNTRHKVRRPRAARACDLCRAKKNKCDELYPCTYCKGKSAPGVGVDLLLTRLTSPDRNAECIYRGQRRFTPEYVDAICERSILLTWLQIRRSSRKPRSAAVCSSWATASRPVQRRRVPYLPKSTRKRPCQRPAQLWPEKHRKR
jgi:hypothetical protein